MMKILLKIVTLLFLTFLGAAQESRRIVCGYASWAIYRQGEGALYPDEINPENCSHLIYAYAGVSPEGELVIIDENSDIQLQGLSKFVQLRARMPNGGVVLLSIGGEDTLSGVAASPRLRKRFAQSCKDLFEIWPFDGLDIAWKYPQRADRQNFVEFLTELRSFFSDNDIDFVLSLTVFRDPTDGYNVTAISKLVDFVNIMTFDYHTPGNGEKRTGHNAPLFDNRTITSQLSISNSVPNWIREGLSSSQVNLGLATFGHSYSLYYEFDKDKPVGQQASVGISGRYTQSPGFLGYNEICNDEGDYEYGFDDIAKVPYKYSDYVWITYDDEQSIKSKTDYIVKENLGGAFIWSLDTDDFRENCDFNILKTVHSEFDVEF